MTNKSVDWQGWLQRWDAQQTGYLPDREARFEAMFQVLHVLLPPDFVALDLACGPGAISQRLLKRFPEARSVAIDFDPLLVEMGRQVLGDQGGRLRWVEADLMTPDWQEKLGETQFDAVLSTTALHWLPTEDLVRVLGLLGKLVRPGGVVLNGDNIPFGPHLPRFDRVAKSYNDELQVDAFQRRGVEDWAMWWNGLKEEAGAQELLAERERRFAWSGTVRGNPIDDFYQAALRTAGFREVGIIWQNMDNKIIMAVR